MYNNPYINQFNPQNNIDRINNQIGELEKMKAQLGSMQVPIINQTFQQTPSSLIKYANSIDEVNKELVIGDTPYFSTDMSVVWIKNIRGEIKAYELNEIIEKDEKDIKIEMLLAQIEELKKGKEDEKSSNTDVVESTKDEKSSSISDGKSSNK